MSIVDVLFLCLPLNIVVPITVVVVHSADVVVALGFVCRCIVVVFALYRAFVVVNVVLAAFVALALFR